MRCSEQYTDMGTSHFRDKTAPRRGTTSFLSQMDLCLLLDSRLQFAILYSGEKNSGEGWLGCFILKLFNIDCSCNLWCRLNFDFLIFGSTIPFFYFFTYFFHLFVKVKHPRQILFCHVWDKIFCQERFF